MGRIKVEEFYSGTLAGGKELLQACGKGVVDACLWNESYNPGLGPLAEIGFVPAVIGSTWSGIMAFNRFIPSFPRSSKSSPEQQRRLPQRHGKPQVQHHQHQTHSLAE